MGIEAGGHRGMFLSQTNESQVGTLALVPQIVDAVKVPVIAAGGIGDGRGLVAALALGASAVQIGTAYMLSSQSLISAQHRAALKHATEADTALTNLFSGRSARGIVNRLMREIGPMNSCAPEFPLAGGALAPLRAKTEPTGSTDFVSLWSGQAGRFAVEESAEAITQRIAKEALDRIAYLTL
jgi:nitronate monooxygenase